MACVSWWKSLTERDKIQRKLDGIVNFLLGQVMKRMPSADPKLARQILITKLDKEIGPEQVRPLWWSQGSAF